MLFTSYPTPFPSHEDDLDPSLLLESIHSRVVDFFPQPPLTGGTRAGCVANCDQDGPGALLLGTIN